MAHMRSDVVVSFHVRHAACARRMKNYGQFIERQISLVSKNVVLRYSEGSAQPYAQARSFAALRMTPCAHTDIIILTLYKRWFDLALDNPRSSAFIGGLASRILMLLVGLFQFLDVDLVHLKHGLHDALGFLRVFVAQHFTKSGGDDLPGEAVFVFEPAASGFLAAGGKLLPQLIDFFLRVAVHEK